jgi:hypothetical protein
MVVENVRGAQKWVGRSRGFYGPYHLWGDVPALLPTGRCRKGEGSGREWWQKNSRASSKSAQRKKWSAEIAKIPEPLGRHIARIYRDAAPWPWPESLA